MIQIEDAYVKYVGMEQESLSNLSLTIPDGQCVLLCGESGCGKTTLTRLINGLIPHYFEGDFHGNVIVNGLNVMEEELYDIAGVVGSVFQNPRSQFFCVDTTSEVAFGCENKGLPEKEILSRIQKVSDDLNMKNLLDRDIFRLSGGEKQKVACASVSALFPDVMVLDEPTSNLDSKAINELAETVNKWKSEGKTVIIAEHRLYWLKTLCDRVIYLRDGHISLDVSMKEFSNYKRDRLKELGLRALEKEKIAPRVDWQPKEMMALKNFMFSYENQVALSIPEVSVPVGGVIAVIGHNGAGKSTFVRCLCGLEHKFKGYVEVNGKQLHRKALLKKCYMVMQDVNHQLFCETVDDEIQLGMQENCEVDVDSIMKMLDLEKLSERHPMSLSGGQKQRVAIASAYLADKSILIFDEPTSGLDYKHMEKTGELLKALSGNKTTFIVTHDPELINRCCTHVLHLESGCVESVYSLDVEGIRRVQDFFLN